MSFNFSHFFIKRHIGICPYEEVLLRVKEQSNILHEIRLTVLRRNCTLQQVTEGKIKGGIEVTGR
jgi:hypothetical protein